jgi:hypothetical protein
MYSSLGCFSSFLQATIVGFNWFSTDQVSKTAKKVPKEIRMEAKKSIAKKYL